MSKGMPLPQGDKTAKPRKPPKVGPDANPKTRHGGYETAPKLPERDGPAKGRGSGKVAGKPKTSKKVISSMKDSLGKMK